MRFIILALFIFSLFLSCLKLGYCTFQSEYPHVKICNSFLVPENLNHEKDVMEGIRHFINNNCTHVQGSIYVRLITKTESIILDDIEEINGDVVFETTNLKKISMKKLRIIRGFSKRTMTLNNTKFSFSLQVSGNKNLETLDLRSLRAIQNHNVFIGSNTKLRYLPQKINWKQLFTNTKQQKLITFDDKLSGIDACSTKCSVSGNTRYCWGPEEEQCQIETKCNAKLASECSSCFKSNNDYTCCDDQCIGGCFNHGPKNCYACKNNLNGNKCMEGCPSRYKGSTGVAVENENFKFQTSSFCSKSCPVDMKEEETRCVYECSEGYFLNKTVCTKCFGDTCKALPCDTIKLEEKLGLNIQHYLTGSLLQQLTNCTKLHGFLILTSESFSKYNVTVDMLYKHLKNVIEIEGGFSYYVDKHLTNLTFLENLKVYRSMKLSASNKNQERLNRFVITKTDLEFLGLRSFEKVEGYVHVLGNEKLCYLDLPWKDIAEKSIIKSGNVNCKDKICDEQCSDKGCWGPGNAMCFQCKYFKAGKKCVTKCSLENGYYATTLDIANKTCSKCHPECAKTCDGPLNSNCKGGCRNKWENNTCVVQCSYNHYAEKNSNKCLPCNNACYSGTPSQKVCTGPSNKHGQNGCNYCNYILLDSNKVMQHCVKSCPSKTYPTTDVKQYNDIFFISVKFGCVPCHPLCNNCSGSSDHKDACKLCSGVWYKSRCVKKCPSNNSYNQTLDNVCLTCHPQCEGGCTGPTKINCTGCKKVKIYIDKKLFYCNETCPPEKKNVEIESSTGAKICVSEWESKARQDEIKRTKITIATVLTMLLFVIIVIIIIIIYLRRKAANEKFENEMKARYSNVMEPCSKDENAFNRPANMGRLAIISIDDLIFEDQARPLGFGAFGYVYKGKWRVPKEESNLLRKANKEYYLPVAIKVIKNITIQENEAIMEEAKIMASVSHQHCLRFIGICLSYEKPCLVTSYLKEGSLDKFLIRNKSSITSYIMLSWAEQIADGMLYLSRRGIIHRDLAARNVLVNQSAFVQITDFGLSKMLENAKDKEIVIKSGKVPIRWLAFETLNEGRYSHETDVWAYGVTLWEIFTFGKVPYEDQNTTDISDFVLKGGRLPQPDICSLDVYINLVNCWLESPNLRPDFETLLNIFSSYCKNPGRYLSIEGDPYEIPSPTNIEMNNINSYMEQHEQMTAETTLPLLSDGNYSTHNNNNSINMNNNNNNNKTRQSEIDRTIDEEPSEVQLPTRSNKSLNPFKKFYDNRNSSHPNTATTPAPTLATHDRFSTSDDESRYVADPTEQHTVKIRNPPPPINTNSNFPKSGSRRPLLSETPRFQSTSSAGKPNTRSMPDEIDGYLEPVISKKPPGHSRAINSQADEYLEPVKNTDDEYLTPTSSIPPSVTIQGKHRSHQPPTPNQYQNQQYPVRISNEIRDIDDDDRSPINLYFPQNTLDDYLEPKQNLPPK